MKSGDPPGMPPMSISLPAEIQGKVLSMLALSHDERIAKLDELCEQFPEQAERIRAQAEGHEAIEQHLQVSLGLADPENDRVGSYQVVDFIDAGGMGVVYLAEQKEPLRRLVAVKLIKRGEENQQALRRFDVERQSLALMEHDNIARVFDAGATDDGRPFLVMEYVKGVPITTYCDEHLLPIRQRLGLFQQVCAGVQHAHHKGVIHRDLKPANVLVTLQSGYPVVKLIDFGLARPAGDRLLGAEASSEQGRLIGTVEYMSPEQAGLSGLDVDARTDVYSLGVILYELLVGDLPFPSSELRNLRSREIQQTIREVSPPKPSTRVSTDRARSERYARQRATNVRGLHGNLRGDLDRITMKALEKDRTQRYETPSTLADDVRRYLAHEPCEAGPSSAGYVLGKLLRRNRKGVLVGSGSLLTVLITVWLALSWSESWAMNRELEALGSTDSLTGPVADLEEGGARIAKIRSSLQDISRVRGRFQLDGAQLARLAALETKLHDGARSVARVASSWIGAALRDQRSNASGFDLPALTGAVGLLQSAADTLPDGDAERVTGILDGLKPRVTIRSIPSGASVYVQRLDQVSGLPIAGAERQGIGTSDLFDAPITRGYYRFIVSDGERYCEATALLSTYGRSYSLPTFYLRSLAESTKGMKLVDAPSYYAGERRVDNGFLRLTGHVHVPAFYIDEHEVTNAEYRRFVLATGRPPPREWPEDYATNWQKEWDDLPVAWVDVFDAHAFAAWMGKRLPMAVEWCLAMRGPEGNLYPWGNDPIPEAELSRYCNIRKRSDKGLTPWMSYLHNVCPVGSFPLGASPFGLTEGFGNVSEWTDSFSISQVDDGVWLPQLGSYNVLGNSWQRPGRSLEGKFLVVSMSEDPAIGFRCVKSVLH